MIVSSLIRKATNKKGKGKGNKEGAHIAFDRVGYYPNPDKINLYCCG